MKTNILLIGLIIFLVNVISVNAKETIKTCSPNDIWRGVNYFVFPEDGGKPYGSHVGTLLSLTNSLNLEIEFVQVKDGEEEGFGTLSSNEMTFPIPKYSNSLEYLSHLAKTYKVSSPLMICLMTG